ncbi:MAG: UDP-4-amino-4,6-dideoxy-N-acetyl-beta-L-altrosamine transaminase [Caldiserica bacterium]|jgi:UDP-4-amino-4,6-dideoxy-N-acetyl-beta-L-altrosamine transaminase|nr:UDP-4-amino-4,6-dideoxy-N-acetyl-beta-L-altrosamine transaminase [Caldisericota bacterium]MDH7563095.1 UDP-4-amino-4,6-dideoxy-N-acetyl-beta-L-altrosamine transaminase [Caldisericota bacterium]
MKPIKKEKPGENPVRASYLPFSQPWIEEEEIRGVVEVLKSGWLTTGRKTLQFEEEFSKYIGVPHSLAFNSCTGGLHCALAALGIGPGDEVITSVFTFAATANVVCHLGAEPVFVDIDPQTLNIDHKKIEEKISPRTKAIIPVHYGGRPCEMDNILALAKKYNLYVVEDAAHALGAIYKGKMIGALDSQVTCFSFYPTKCITTGEGGMNTTRSPELASKMKTWRLHGISRDAWDRYQKGGSWYYEVVSPGYKYNLTDLASAIGIAQLKKAEEFQRRREKIVSRYFKALKDFPFILPPPFKEGRNAWHLFPIQLKLEELNCTREEFIEALSKENIGTSVHFIPLHLMPFYREKGWKEGDFPNAEEAFRRIISLPLFPKMSEEDQESVIMALEKVVGWYSK